MTPETNEWHVKKKQKQKKGKRSMSKISTFFPLVFTLGLFQAVPNYVLILLMVNTSPSLIMMIVTFPISDTVKCKMCDAGWDRRIVDTKNGRWKPPKGLKNQEKYEMILHDLVHLLPPQNIIIIQKMVLLHMIKKCGFPNSLRPRAWLST
jgi:hypothetical protein